MQMRSYAVLAWRAFLYAVFMAGLGIFAEAITDFMSNPHAHFTSVFALAVFSAAIGDAPVLLSPSRLSSGSLGLGARVFLIIEFTVFLVIGIVASEKYKVFENAGDSDFSTLVGNSIFLSMFLYMAILIISLLSNLPKLKREIMEFRGRNI